MVLIYLPVVSKRKQEQGERLTFLLAIDDVMRFVLGELGFAGQVGDVGAGVRLCDGETDALVTVEDVGDYAVDQCLLAVFHDWWNAYSESTEEVPHETTTAGPGELVLFPA